MPDPIYIRYEPDDVLLVSKALWSAMSQADISTEERERLSTIRRFFGSAQAEYTSAIVEMPSKLSITAAIADRSIRELSEGFASRMRDDADNLVRVASAYVDELLLRAYTEGVRDGFVQGAQAQADIEEKTKECP